MEQTQAPAALNIFSITAPDGTLICQVTERGQFFWADHAARSIADTTIWPIEYTGIRFLLHAVYNIELEPLDAREMFSALNVAIPDSLVPGTPEYETEVKFQVFRQGISYGRRYLLELSGPEFAQLAPVYSALLEHIGQIAFAAGAHTPIGDEAWKQLDALLIQSRGLLSTLHRIGKDCEHEVVPVANEDDSQVIAVACVYCHQQFKVWQPTVEESPEPVALQTKLETFPESEYLGIQDRSVQHVQLDDNDPKPQETVEGIVKKLQREDPNAEQPREYENNWTSGEAVKPND